MQIDSTRRKSNPSTSRTLFSVLGLALLALVFFQSPARGQAHTRQVTVIQDMVSVGIVPGQTLRITVLNPEDSGASFRGHIKIFDGSGTLLFQTPDAEIAPGEFHPFDVDRADIALPGEVRTGRYQVHARLTGLRSASATEPGGPRSKARIDRLPASLEIIDNDTGKTTGMLLPAIQKVRQAASRN